MPESTVHRILSTVEQLAPEARGAFLVGLDDAPVGSILVEHNQVCWAAHARLHSRLRELLRESFDELGDNPASRDLSGEAMRRALKTHTVESLMRLPQRQGERVDWIAHRRDGYQPRFTFSPAELLVAVNARLLGLEAQGPEADRLPALVARSRAATFVQIEGGELMAIALGEWPMTIAELDELGSWAEAAFGVVSGFSRAVMKRVVETADGEVCVAWRTSPGHVHAAMMERGPDLDRLVASIEDANVPAVVSRRATRPSLTALRDALGSVERNT